MQGQVSATVPMLPAPHSPRPPVAEEIKAAEAALVGAMTAPWLLHVATQDARVSLWAGQAHMWRGQAGVQGPRPVVCCEEPGGLFKHRAPGRRWPLGLGHGDGGAAPPGAALRLTTQKLQTLS